MGLLRKTVRISSLGLVGDSPKNQQRKAEAKLAKAEAKRVKAETKAVKRGS